jgi:hypothetical protein
MGDTATLGGLERHADLYMAPSWRDGGFFFPRNDALEDGEGNRTLMEPMCGNVLLGYASLNVPDGLWKLYNEPISANERCYPALVEVGDGVDVLHARFDVQKQCLHFTLRSCAIKCAGFEVLIGRIGARGRWSLSMDERNVAEGAGSSISSSSLERLRPGKDGLLIDCTEMSAARFTLAFEPA